MNVGRVEYSVIEESIKSKSKTSILALRKMLVVPYFEKVKSFVFLIVYNGFEVDGISGEFTGL